MIDKNITIQEIQHALVGKGDYVKIDYLERLLKESVSMASRNFEMQKLAEIYKSRGMHPSAAKCFEALGISAMTSGDKVKNFTAEAECYIVAGHFDKVDFALKRAMSEANPVERQAVYDSVKELYKSYALQFEKERNKRNYASKMYEKLLEMRLSETERKDIKEKLMKLYQELGKIQELFKLKNTSDKILQRNRNDIEMFDSEKDFHPSRDQFSERKERRFLGIDGLDI
jgi:hypothetical protein